MKTFISDNEACEQICSVGRKMYERGFVASNDGNISVRVADGIWITPTGVSKGSLTPDMLLKLDGEGNILSGSGKKSTETGMHLRLYKENHDIMAITHAHPPFATSFAVARIPLDRHVYPEALTVVGEIPLAPFAYPGTPAVADSVAPFAKTHNALLLANHGALSWGENLNQAWFRLESTENFAKIYFFSQFLPGGAKEFE